MIHPAGTILDHHGQPLVHSESLPPHFEGASVAARIGNWGMSSAGPNGSATSIASLRNRARESERNNPTAKGGIDSFVANLVGTDISPSWNLDNKEQKDELEQLWDDSQSEADYYGISDFYGTQELAARAVVRDGEVLSRFHDVEPTARLVVPLQTQLLEADHLDLAYNDISPEGNEIRFGIEWKHGRRYKYWLWNDHPGESFLTRANIFRQPVSASDMTHVFRPLRPGQARGVSWLAPIIVKLHDIDIYDDAEVVRKGAAALWGGFIYSDAPVVNRNLSAPDKEPQTKREIILKPGTFPVLANGQKIEFSKTADVGNNYLDFMKNQFRMIARGLGITYEQLTGDLSGVTYTSLRAGLIEFRRLCETIILRTLVFQYCRPYINRWIYTAVLNGALETISVSEYLKKPRIFHRVNWNLDGWDFTDPVKDRVAEQMDIRNGIETRGQKIAKRGGNINRVDKQNTHEREQAEAGGNRYDCYPAQTTKTGILQNVEDQVILDSVKNQ
ncbi:MAG: phage portal protein [Proteobacteria bacterium]|nr:phage portal protein [Pseudomonadota bacterium]